MINTPTLDRAIARRCNADQIFAAARRDTEQIEAHINRARAVPHSTTMRLSTLTAVQLRAIVDAAGELIYVPEIAAIRLDTWGDAIVRVTLGSEARDGHGDVRHDNVSGRALISVRLDASFDHAAAEIRGIARYQLQSAADYAACRDNI